MRGQQRNLVELRRRKFDIRTTLSELKDNGNMIFLLHKNSYDQAYLGRTMLSRPGQRWANGCHLVGIHNGIIIADVKIEMLQQKWGRFVSSCWQQTKV